MDRDIIRGVAYVFGDDVNTDLISPAQYMEQGRAVMAAHVMEGADLRFSRDFTPGGIVVAGSNFGSGSSRETAPVALKDRGVAAVAAVFFARIFYRNCLNIGLPALICPRAGEIAPMDELSLDLPGGVIHNLTQGTEYPCTKLSPVAMELIAHGGLLGKLTHQMEEDGKCTRK